MSLDIKQGADGGRVTVVFEGHLSAQEGATSAFLGKPYELVDSEGASDQTS